VSIELNPNVHAVSLMFQVKEVIMANLRGDAEKSKGELEILILDKCRNFAVEVSLFLDSEIAKITNKVPSANSNTILSFKKKDETAQ